MNRLKETGEGNTVSNFSVTRLIDSLMVQFNARKIEIFSVFSEFDISELD